jgi:hypothetical protein
MAMVYLQLLLDQPDSWVDLLRDGVRYACCVGLVAAGVGDLQTAPVDTVTFMSDGAMLRWAYIRVVQWRAGSHSTAMPLHFVFSLP